MIFGQITNFLVEGVVKHTLISTFIMGSELLE